MFAPLGAVGGTAIGEAGELIGDGVNALLAAYSDASGAATDALEEIGEAASQAASEVESGGCFLAGTDVLLGNRRTEEPIQDIQVGQRVATDGGVANSATGTASTDQNATAVNRKTWRLVTLVMDEGVIDGQEDIVQIQALEPLSEIRKERAHVGAYVPVPIDLADMGLPNALAEVISIGACPAIASGPGRVVLATVTHLNNFLFDLTLTNIIGQSEVIGVTGYHKIYTEDLGWVNASQLKMGEKVRGAEGDLTVTSLVRDPGVFHIYNISVEDDHVYYVGDLQALVHNTFCAGNFRQALSELTGLNPSDAQAHHIFPQALGDVFESYGIDIHDPQYGAWWNTVEHQASSYAYQVEWEEFLEGSPSLPEVFDFASQIVEKYVSF